MKKNILALIIVAMLGTMSYGQNSLTNFLKAGVDDAELLFESYFEPYGKALGANLNGGWVNTAKVHNTLGFDVTLTLTTTFIPSEAETFDLSELNLQHFTLADPTKTMAPTIAGYDSPGPELVYATNPITGEKYSTSTPLGSGYAMLPLPMIKASIGIPGNTEIMGRFMPTMKVVPDKDFEIGQWGIGAKHDLKQYIPFIKRVPVLNLSLMAAYSQLKTSAGLNLNPYGNPMDLTSNSVVTTEGYFDGQEFEMEAKGFTSNLLFSVNLPVLCFYTGVGISSTKTNVMFNGEYPITSVGTDPSDLSTFGKLVLRDEDILTDPIDVEIEGNDGLRYLLGMRVKMAIVTLHADWTYADYSVLSAGIGITFR